LRFESFELLKVLREARVPGGDIKEGKKAAIRMKSLTNLEWTNGKSIIS